jgi:phospholipid transport system transporter-binding protein
MPLSNGLSGKLARLPMSEFDFQEQGEGRFSLSGDMSFETANQILKASERLLDKHAAIEIDLAGVGKADSAGLALMLEWKAQAGQRGVAIQFVGIPKSILAVAKTSEVNDLI